MADFTIDDHTVLELVETAVVATRDRLDARVPDSQEAALAKLNEETGPSSQHPLVLYYKATLEDLLGKYPDALQHYNALLRQIPPWETRQLSGIQNNIRVVEYHMLRREAVLHPDRPDYQQRMKTALRAVFPEENPDKSAGSNAAHRDALEARFLALACRPDPQRLADSDETKRIEERNRIERVYGRVIELTGRVLAGPHVWLKLRFLLARWLCFLPARRLRFLPARWLRFLPVKRWKEAVACWKEAAERWKEAIAIAHLARGRARLYLSDARTWDQHDRRMADLDTARDELEAAHNAFPGDYTYICDLASYEMRLGRWTNNVDLFEAAELKLIRVLSRLRPNYGFGVFELGRVYRLWGKFDQALSYSRRAMMMDEATRGITTDRVEREIWLAENRDRSFVP
jgi:tetratricopeptide (TPR) repeat protein